LWGGREESDLNLFLAEFIGELNDRVPGPGTDGSTVLVQVVDQVDLSTSIDSDLVAGTNGQTRVVARPEVHKALAGGRVSLFVEGARDGELGVNGRLEASHRTEVGGLDEDGGGLGARGNIGAGGGGDTVLDVGARHRVGVEGLDVEHNGNNVHVKPEPRADIGRLVRLPSDID